MASAGTPVVFVHGLWLHADSWGAWVDLFREAGYEPSAPGWPGDAATRSRRPGRNAGRASPATASTTSSTTTPRSSAGSTRSRS